MFIDYIDTQRALVFNTQFFKANGLFTERVVDKLRQPVHGQTAAQAKATTGKRRRVAPLVFGFQTKLKSLTGFAQRRHNRFPVNWRTWHDGDVGRLGQRYVMTGSADVGQHFKLEASLTERLHFHTRAAFAVVTKDDGDFIALA